MYIYMYLYICIYIYVKVTYLHMYHEHMHMCFLNLYVCIYVLDISGISMFYEYIHIYIHTLWKNCMCFCYESLIIWDFKNDHSRGLSTIEIVDTFSSTFRRWVKDKARLGVFCWFAPKKRCSKNVMASILASFFNPSLF